MKTLLIVRHAKSSWSFNMADHDRPLGERGRKDVFKMGHYLAKNIDRPELIVSSPASRALYTALFIADQWGYPEDKIQIDSSIYHGAVSNLVDTLSKIKNHSSVALFGHNPGLTDLVNELSDSYIENIPTCGVVGLRFDIPEWKAITRTKGEQFLFLKPKSLP